MIYSIALLNKKAQGLFTLYTYRNLPVQFNFSRKVAK